MLATLERPLKVWRFFQQIRFHKCSNFAKRLILFVLVSHRKLFASLRATARQNFSSAFRGHSCAETKFSVAFNSTGLICPFHGILLFCREIFPKDFCLSVKLYHIFEILVNKNTTNERRKISSKLSNFRQNKIISIKNNVGIAGGITGNISRHFSLNISGKFKIVAEISRQF